MPVAGTLTEPKLYTTKPIAGLLTGVTLLVKLVKVTRGKSKPLLVEVISSIAEGSAVPAVEAMRTPFCAKRGCIVIKIIAAKSR